MVKYVLISAVLLLGMYTLYGFYQPFWLVEKVQKWIPGALFYVPTEEKQFALTFDDGPNPHVTDHVLDMLDEHDMKATFFLVGQRMEKHPEYAQKIIDRGHEVANHMYSDVPAVALSSEALLNSVSKTDALLPEGARGNYMRPASGLLRPSQYRLLKKEGYTPVLGSAHVSDPFNPSGAYMLWALKRTLRPGAIIILHDRSPNTDVLFEILPQFLAYADNQGFQSVPLSELRQN